MIKSMTGFGRAELTNKDMEVSAEVRSVNNRFFDVQVRLPKNYDHLEHEVKSLVKQHTSRGRLSVFINLKIPGDDMVDGIKINHEYVEQHWNLLKHLKKKYKIPGKLSLQHLLMFQDIFVHEDNEKFSDQNWQIIEQVLIQALKNFSQMREKEGRELAKDLRKRIQLLEGKINKIEQISSRRHEEEVAKLRERIKEIVAASKVDEIRLETEIGILVNRMDVTEECIRFHSHNKLFVGSLEEEEAAGRKLNFLLQEMTREANTIGSKANQTEISHLVVEIKEEVEKIREQVQNIE